MSRPLCPPRRHPARRGAALIVVPALLGLFALMALSFVFYADSEATGSRLYREREARPDVIPPSTDDALNTFFGTLLYDADGNTARDLQNPLRGHSLLRDMYGWGGVAATGAAPNLAYNHTTPFNGVGTFHQQVALPGGAAFDRAVIVNNSLFQMSNQPVVFDPEWMLPPGSTGPAYRQANKNGRLVAAPTTTTPGTAARRMFTFVPKNAPYTYPDLKSFYLASVSPATGEVLVPSFHRDWVFLKRGGTAADWTPPAGNTALHPTNPNWTSPFGRALILRPRPQDQLYNGTIEFPGVPANADGTFTGDVQNLPGGVGVQKNDSLWMDLGLAPFQWNGRWVKPLVATLIVDNEGRVNLSAHGNTRNGGNHTSYAGYGPHEVSLARVFDPTLITNPTAVGEANAVVNGRFNGTPLQSAGGLASRYYDGTATTPVLLPAYALVNWDGTGTATPAPVFQIPTGIQTAPTYGGTNFFDNNTTAAKALGHPALFNPFDWPDRRPGATPAANTGTRYPLDDLRRLTLRYADTPDAYDPTRVAVDGFATTTLRGQGTTATYQYQEYPLATTAGVYRRDPAHPLRLLTTTRSGVLDVPGLMPNYLDRTTAPVTLTTPPTTAYPSATPQGTFATPATDPAAAASLNRMPTPGTATPGANSDFGARNWGNVLAALGPVDINRGLTDYRTNTSAPLSSANCANYLQAWADRHNLARDIFARLVVATGANATVFTQTTVVGTTTYLPGDVVVNASPTTQATQFAAVRYLAQLAANVVDYVDNDDVSTAFAWYNPTAPTTPLRAVTAADVQATVTAAAAGLGTATNPGGVVFGVEKPRLVLNEVYSEVTNDPNEQAVEPAVAPPGTFKKPSQPFHVRFWVELLNPTAQNNPATGPLGDGTVQLYDAVTKPYKLQIVRATKNGRTIPNDLADPTNTPGMLLSGTNPDIDFNFDSADITGNVGKQKVNAPISPQYQAGGNPANGVALVGPDAKAGAAAIEFVPPAGAPWTQLLKGDPPTGTPDTSLTTGNNTAETRTLEWQIAATATPSLTAAELQTGATLKRHVVLLRRLANPYQPYNVATNPYVTVDYLDHVPSNDAVNRAADTTQAPGQRQDKTMDPNGYEKVDNRYAVGKVQPYASFANVASVGNLAAFPNSFVAKQNPNPPAAGQPMHTFGRHNGKGAAQPANTYTNDPQNRAQALTDTLMVPYDWYVHFDRKLVNQLELMHVQAVAPHRVTQLFLYPNTVQSPPAATAAVRDVGVAPWFWPTNPTPTNVTNPTTTPDTWVQPATVSPTFSLYRALDLLRVKPWGYGVPLAGRVNGKVNINTVQDPRLLLALLDPQTGNGFTANDVYNTANLADPNALWSRLIGSTIPTAGVPYRTPTVSQRTDAAGTTTYPVPVPGRTYDDDPTTNPATLGLTGFDRPFKPFGAPQFAAQNFAGGGSNTGVPATSFGPGLNDTLFRTDATGNPAGWLSYTAGTRTHPYQRAEALRKLFNNVTTVSGTFSVYLTVGFFEVRTDGAGNPAYVTEGRDVNNQEVRRYYLGKEAYISVPGDLRQQFFAVVDRNNAAVEQDPANPAAFVQRDPYTQREGGTAVSSPFFNTSLEANAAAGATTLTLAAPYLDGYAVPIPAGTVLYVGTGSNQERVTVVAAGAAVNGVVTVTVPPLTLARAHPAGEPVANARLGNPGPQNPVAPATQPNFRWNDPRYYGSSNAVIPFLAQIVR